MTHSTSDVVATLAGFIAAVAALAAAVARMVSIWRT